MGRFQCPSLRSGYLPELWVTFYARTLGQVPRPKFGPSSTPQLWAKFHAPTFGQSFTPRVLGKVTRPGLGQRRVPQLLGKVLRPSFWEKFCAPLHSVYNQSPLLTWQNQLNEIIIRWPNTSAQIKKLLKNKTYRIFVYLVRKRLHRGSALVVVAHTTVGTHPSGQRKLDHILERSSP